MSGENYVVQASLKLNDGTLINVRSDNTEEFWNVLGEIEENGHRITETGKHLNAVAGVQNVLGGTVQQVQNTHTPVQAAAAAGPTTETNKWGSSYELNRPDAAGTPFGPAVLKTAKSKAGSWYKQWIDPRSKEIPSNYDKGVRSDPPDKWAGEFVNG